MTLVSQVGALLACSHHTAERRLHGLASDGLASGGLVNRQRIFAGHPAACWITRAGLGAIGSSLPAPGPDLKGYRHDVGLAWLWLAARHGAFGELTGQVSERTMRSADRRRERAGPGAGDPRAVLNCTGEGRYGVGVA